ncbi:MAG: hypothetical protein AB8H03_01260 [Saprospiraceae bacterium]
MKKLLNLVLLVGLFISVSSSEIFSQTITNNTDCPMTIIVFHSCSDNVVYTVDANDTETMSDPAVAASVSAVQFTLGPCGFRLTDGTCVPGSNTGIANCPGAICETYSGVLDANGDITIN